MYYKTTFADELIAFLLSCNSNSIRKKILWERIQKRRKISQNVYYQNINRLKKRGILEDSNGIVYLSRKGKMFFDNPYRRVKEKPLKDNKILVIFDVPETKRKVRTWIRDQIKEWDFKMVQKSVWIGYGPLPKEFIDRLKYLKVNDGVKVYNLRKK